MESDWVKTTLRDAGVSLIDCDHRTPPAAESGYPYIAIPQLKEGRIDLTSVRLISPEHYSEWTKKANPRVHDVILSRRCNPGETAYVPDDLKCALGQNLVLLRSDGKKLFPPFLRWLVRGSEWWEQVGTFINVGAVFNSLKCADIPKFQITLPPLAEQKRIAQILGTLDDKIELNRRMNATLEAIAQALFKSWFVDFDPVRAKASGESEESICQRLGLSREVLALFPDRLVESELGEIPEGWQVTQLGEILSVIETGRRPAGGVAKYTDGIPSIGAESIWGIGKFDYSKTKYIPIEFFKKMNSGKVQHMDVLLYKDGGKPGEFKPRVGMYGHDFPFSEFAINEHVFRLRSEFTGQSFLYFSISDQRILLDLANKGGKAAIPGVNQKDVYSLRLVLPAKSILNIFNKTSAFFCDMILLNQKQSHTTSKLRDELLSMLLAGYTGQKDNTTWQI